MQVILHNDDTIHGYDSALRLAQEALERALKGRADRLSRVEVWVADENAHKGGPDDKRCAMEAHPRGRKPVGVRHHAADVGAAIRGAADKLARVLERDLA